MTTMLPGTIPHKVRYPSSDGKPMSENTLQFQCIVKIQGGLDSQYADDPNVLVVGDLLWYAVQGNPKIRCAPDAMVVFGRPKGHRSSYQQWEEGGIAPQVVFEVRSPGNRFGEMQEKFDFYQRYGVEEYYLFDPDNVVLEGWQRSGAQLVPIPNMQGWVSPRLKIRFDLSSGDLVIYHPDGRPFATYLEVAAQRQQAEEAAREAQDAAAKAQDDATKAREDATKAQDAAAIAQKKQREADERAEKLAAQLRALGVEPEA
jgi:Uma2 family endonuclease